MADLSLDEAEHLSLCEALDRILNKGAVVTGDLTISVADIDLIYVGLRILISSAGALRDPQRAEI
jgi:gas vesicle structural protein